ncbi:MAG: hypothetical protein AAGA93_28060, partial [Actinomycetota bacterium]
MRALAKFLALLFAFTLVAAACGSDDDATEAGGTDTESDASAEEAEESEEDLAGGGIDDDEAADAVEEAAEEEAPEETADAAGSIEELEAQWADARQAVVDQINAEGWGVNEDNVLVGPAGFEIDLNNCPSDWTDDAGLGDAITIGHTTAQSGNLAAYGN